MTKRFFRLPVVMLMVLVVTTLVTAENQKPAKPSAYAPAKDLIAQVNYFLGQIEKDLEDKDEYGEEQQARVAKDSNTVVALASVLGVHDEEHDLKGGAAALKAAAKEIAANVKDHAAASAALAKAQKALEAKSDEKVSLEGGGDLAELMKQVPIVNNQLRDRVMGPRFERLKERSAETAATLAAIAEVSAYDDSYVTDDSDKPKWQEICFEMRDASAAVAKATRAGDKDTAVKELDRLVKTCDACHHAFRD